MKGQSTTEGAEHALATIETIDDKCRYVCSCGARGMLVGSVAAARVDGGPKVPPIVLHAEDWTRGAHRWHAQRVSKGPL